MSAAKAKAEPKKMAKKNIANMDMLLKPRVSEKAYGMSEKGVYVFGVPTNANKHSVARAVAAQFAVTVTEVNIANVKGKTKRSIRNGKAVPGQRNDSKKAYVTLKAGDSIPVFAALVDEKPAEKEKK